MTKEDIMNRARTDAQTIAKTRKHTGTRDYAGAHEEATRNTLAAMSAAPALIGLWAVACVVGALFSVGGPLELVKSWFQAVTGI